MNSCLCYRPAKECQRADGGVGESTVRVVKVEHTQRSLLWKKHNKKKCCPIN